MDVQTLFSLGTVLAFAGMPITIIEGGCHAGSGFFFFVLAVKHVEKYQGQ